MYNVGCHWLVVQITLSFASLNVDYSSARDTPHGDAVRCAMLCETPNDFHAVVSLTHLQYQKAREHTHRLTTGSRLFRGLHS
jgi:hypothetical protein